MKYIYKLLALDKSNSIKHFFGFVVNLFILIMILGLLLLVAGYSVLIISYISKIFFKILIEANIFYKLWLLFFLIVWMKIRKNIDVAKEMDFKLKEYFKSKKQDGLNKYKMILMMLCIYISICLIGFSFYGFTGGKWNEASTANIINIFIWATYLIAPVVVIWAYIDWKSPKQYEIEKQYAEKLLDNINGVYFFMFERVNNLKALSNINNHVVLLNGVVKNPKRYSDTPFYLAHGYLDLLNSMSNKKINKSFLTNFERMTQLLDGHSNYIEEQYSLYYTPFSDELKSNHSIMCTPYDRIDLNAEQRVAIFQLNRYLTETLDSEVIEENGEKITVNLTFKEYIAKFKEEYEVLVNEIVVKYIKIQEY